MKITKRIGALLLVAALLACSVFATSCGSSANGGENDGTPVYKVTVKDAMGVPYGDSVIVKFMKNGTQEAMQICNADGVAERELPAGDYTVELAFTGDAEQYDYTGNDLTLTADKTELNVVLSYKITAEAKSLHVNSEEHEAYDIGVGCTKVSLKAGERNYFLFTPTTAATYEFTVIDNAAEIGYYGAPHYVQSLSAAEVVDNKFTLSVTDGMIGKDSGGTSVLVVGVDPAEGVEECIISITNAGGPAWSVESEPWTVYTTTAELSPYSLPAGAKIGEFDLTAATDAYKIVFNETDGYYHLNTKDGPLVLVRLGVDTQYLACFKTMLDRSGVVKYFYDENGEFEKKESYSECLLEYIENIDEENGVYPLTEDLKYIIQQRGEYAGWWDPKSNGYCFMDEEGRDLTTINCDIAWLLFCCYIEG